MVVDTIGTPSSGLVSHTDDPYVSSSSQCGLLFSPLGRSLHPGVKEILMC